MASQLSEAEERERAFCGRGRGNQVRTLAEAKNVMNFLFNLASSSRCQLRDREVDCREKDSEIRELKEKVVNLVRQLELKKAEFNRQETLMKLALERQTEEKSSGSMANNSDGHAYDLRPKGSRNSTILDSGLYVLELPEDMDTSYDQHLYSEDAEWVHPTERKKHQSRKRNSNTCCCSKVSTRHRDVNAELQVAFVVHHVVVGLLHAKIIGHRNPRCSKKRRSNCEGYVAAVGRYVDE